MSRYILRYSPEAEFFLFGPNGGTEARLIVVNDDAALSSPLHGVAGS